MRDNSATVATLDVCQHEKHSVTLCPCGKPARRKFCSGACRQAAYRTSAAFLTNKKRWEYARTARRAEWESRRHRDKHLTFDGLHGGNLVAGVPRLGELNLKKYLEKQA
jgi:CDGSH-type Zn-finger protein